ncbi:DUF190 domain-containing protein [Brevibacillus sp. B_LB10_24]|uniref:DUF190 domain-containing protein n=1 Tax=Brevibacillus sp. B_LB10_24 TaxID=3380645 RepID=UPI0038B6E3BD
MVPSLLLLLPIGSNAEEVVVMSLQKLLQIVVGEFEIGKDNRLLYRDIAQILQQTGFSDLTCIRADEGIGEKNDLRVLSFESIQLNNLPIAIETVEEEERIEQPIPELSHMIPHGKMITTPVYRLFANELTLHDDEYVMLKIYTQAKGKWFGRKVHDDILEVFRENHLIWSTVIHGMDKPFSFFSSQRPVVIESIGTAGIVKKMIPELQKLIKEGLVIAIPIEVILNR